MRKSTMALLASATLLAMPLAAGLYAVAQDDTGDAAVKAENVNPAEMETQADKMLETMRATRKHVQTLLEQARKDKDIIKITCLNDKLTQINVAVRTFEDRVVSLRTAKLTGNAESITHEYNILVVLEGKVDGLRMEAEACIGETEGYLGKTEVTVTRPEGQTDRDVTEFEDVGTEMTERPIPASAFE